MLTRQQGQAMLTHILDSVFWLDKESSLYKALLADRYTDIQELINMSYSDINKQTNKQTNNSKITTH